MTAIEDWKSLGSQRKLAGHNIFCIDSGGNKPVVLMIHGFPTASWDWHKLWPKLQADYRLIALDMLGFGFSDKPVKHQYSIMEQADIVEALIAELKLACCHVLAHDYGDTVAQELLARQNEGRGAGQWLSLCLLNGGLFPETHRARLVQKLLLSPLGGLINAALGKPQFARSMNGVFGPETQASDQEIDAFWQLVNHNDGRHVFHKLIGYMRERRQHRERWVSALCDSQIPIGLINGSLDPVSGAHMVARYRELVRPDDFIVALPDIGHYPQVEDVDGVEEAYRRFLSGSGQEKPFET